jgi:hypothetical protein
VGSVRNDVSDKCIVFMIRAVRISDLGKLAITSNSKHTAKKHQLININT